MFLFTQDLLRKENEELKDRVRCGAYEYTKLFEKLRLVKNQKFNNELNVYPDLNAHQDDENKLRRRSNLASSPENDTHSQSSSQMAQRACEADSQNTLLDALLGTSFYNGTWNQEKSAASVQAKQYTTQPTKLQTSPLTPAAKTATISQPKSSQTRSSNMSDDGLVQTRGGEGNLSEKLSRCQIGIARQRSDTKEA